MNRFLGRNPFSPTRLPPSATHDPYLDTAIARLAPFSSLFSLSSPSIPFISFFSSFSTLPSCSPIPFCTSAPSLSGVPHACPSTNHARCEQTNRVHFSAILSVPVYRAFRLLHEQDRARPFYRLQPRLNLFSRVERVCRKTQLDSSFDLRPATDKSRVIFRGR